jgi:hypothetical protein
MKITSLFLVALTFAAPAFSAPMKLIEIQKYTQKAAELARDNENYKECLDRGNTHRFFTNDCSRYAVKATDAMDALGDSLNSCLYLKKFSFSKISKELDIDLPKFEGMNCEYGTRAYIEANRLQEIVSNAHTTILVQRYLESMTYNKHTLAVSVHERMVTLVKEISGAIAPEGKAWTPDTTNDNSSNDDMTNSQMLINTVVVPMLIQKANQKP